MTARSNSAAVRNPIAADPEVCAILSEMSPEGREILARVLTRLSKTWRAKADHSWRKGKPPVAAYWKSNSVNARHLSLAVRKVRA